MNMQKSSEKLGMEDNSEMIFISYDFVIGPLVDIRVTI